MSLIILNLILWGLTFWFALELRAISLRRLPWLQLKATNDTFFKAMRSRRYFLFEPSRHNATHARQLRILSLVTALIALGYSAISIFVRQSPVDFLIGLGVFWLGCAFGLWQYRRLLMAAVNYWQVQGTAGVPFTLATTESSLPKLKHRFNKLLMIEGLLFLAMVLPILVPLLLAS